MNNLSFFDSIKFSDNGQKNLWNRIAESSENYWGFGRKIVVIKKGDDRILHLRPQGVSPEGFLTPLPSRIKEIGKSILYGLSFCTVIIPVFMLFLKTINRTSQKLELKDPTKEEILADIKEQLNKLPSYTEYLAYMQHCSKSLHPVFTTKDGRHWEVAGNDNGTAFLIERDLRTGQVVKDKNNQKPRHHITKDEVANLFSTIKNKPELQIDANANPEWLLHDLNLNLRKLLKNNHWANIGLFFENDGGFGYLILEDSSGIKWRLNKSIADGQYFLAMHEQETIDQAKKQGNPYVYKLSQQDAELLFCAISKSYRNFTMHPNDSAHLKRMFQKPE